MFMKVALVYMMEESTFDSATNQHQVPSTFIE